MVNYRTRKADKEAASKKTHQENLQLLLKEAFIYHRDAISMVFKVTLTCGTVFAGLMAIYITLSKESPDLTLESMRFSLAWFGFVSSVISLFVQWLSIRAYLLSGHLYLHPLRELAGLKDVPPTGGKRRAKLEFLIALVLYLIYVIYMGAWLWLLKYNHCFFGCVKTGGIYV
jgi:hypothetical protein